LRVGDGRALLPHGGLVLAATWRGATPRMARSYPLATRLFRKEPPPHPFDKGAGHTTGLPGLPRLLVERDLAALARTVGGRGPGLTPSGDDVLAGALFVAGLQGHQPADLRAVAVGARTSTIATAFLLAAAEGHCIEPAHDLITAIHDGAEAAAGAACAALRTYGASSGAALTYGILGSLAEQPTVPPR
jgi:Protein of unknown function (DUF2877)